jgi:hypothetical protein
MGQTGVQVEVRRVQRPLGGGLAALIRDTEAKTIVIEVDYSCSPAMAEALNAVLMQLPLR